MKKLVIILILFSLFNLNCITMEYNNYISKKQRVEREFKYKQDFEKIVTGINSGIITFKNKKYYLLQFENTLKGKGRYLNCYVSIDKNKPFIQESSQKLYGKKIAFFLYIDTVSDFKYDFLSPRSKNDKSSPIEYLKKYNIKLDDDWPIIGIVLNQSSSNYFSITGVVWNLDMNGKPNVVNTNITIYDSDLFSFNRDKLQINWVKRSYTQQIVYYLGFLGTIPADIITSPFQLIFAIQYLL